MQCTSATAVACDTRASAVNGVWRVSLYLYRWKGEARESERESERDGMQGTCCIKNTDLRQMRQWPRQFNLRNSTMVTMSSDGIEGREVKKDASSRTTVELGMHDCSIPR